MEHDYDIWTFATDPNGETRGYIPAMIRGGPGCWDLRRIMEYFVGEANLCRDEIYRGGSALIQVRFHKQPHVLVAYEVTGSYTRGFIWRAL